MDSNVPSQFLKPAQGSTRYSKSLDQRAKPYSRAAVNKPELTPLTRLAKFKAIRDRHLKQPHPIQKRQSASKQIMEGKVNGVNEPDTTIIKEKVFPRALNGSGGPSLKDIGNSESTNAVQENSPASANNVEKVNVNKEMANQPNLPIVPDTNDESVIKSVEIDSHAQEEVVLVDDPKEGSSSTQQVEPESLEGGDSNGSMPTEESEGSSLDVVGDFASIDELDPKLCLDSSDDEIYSTESIEQSQPISEETEPVEVFVPDIVRQLAVGKMRIRPTLRGEYESPQLKRKLGSGPTISKKMRAADDGSSSSPGWKFFTPSLPFNKLWTSAPSLTKRDDDDDVTGTTKADDSLLVNIGDQSNIISELEGESTKALIKDMQEEKSSLSRWCNLM